MQLTLSVTGGSSTPCRKFFGFFVSDKKKIYTMSGQRFSYDLENLNYAKWDYLAIYEASFFSVWNFTWIIYILSGGNEARKQYDCDYSKFVVDNNKFYWICVIDSILRGNEQINQKGWSNCFLETYWHNRGIRETGWWGWGESFWV